MIQPPLPEMTIPASILFNPGLSAGVLLTMIQLAALSANESSPTSFSLRELSELTGKSQRTLSRHIRHLISSNYVVIQLIASGRFTISLPEVHPFQRLYPNFQTDPHSCTPPISLSPKFPEFNSYFPERIMGYISYQSDDE